MADVSKAAVARAARMHACPAIVIGDRLDDLPVSDLALLAAPVGVRRPYYDLLADRPTAVYAEKPIATTIEDATWLAQRFGPSRLVCGFQRRFYANFQLLRAAVTERWFGPLRRIVVRDGARTAATGVDSSFREDAALSGGGILMELGCHSLDLVHFLTGSPQCEVVNHRLTFDGDVDREVELELVCQMSSVEQDVDVRLSLSWLRPLPDMFRLDFDGCSLLTTGRPGGVVHVRARKSSSCGASLTIDGSRFATTLNRAVHLAWRSFIDATAAGASAELGVTSCLPTIELIDRIYRMSGRP